MRLPESLELLNPYPALSARGTCTMRSNNRAGEYTVQ